MVCTTRAIMRTNGPTLVSFLSATALGLFGCGGGEAGPGTGDEQNLTESVALTVTAFIVGDDSSSQATADTTWNEACREWAKRTVALAGQGGALGLDCGKPTNLHPGSWFLYGAEAKLELRVQVPEGGAPVKSATGRISGDESSE